MFTIGPGLRAIMYGSTARVKWCVPSSATWMHCCHSSGVDSSTAWNSPRCAALLHSTSMRPSRPRPSDTARATSSGDDTSALQNAACPPARRMASAAASPASSSTSTSVDVRALLRRSTRLIARPMPWAAPVTMAILSSSRFMSAGILACGRARCQRIRGRLRRMHCPAVLDIAALPRGPPLAGVARDACFKDALGAGPCSVASPSSSGSRKSRAWPHVRAARAPFRLPEELGAHACC